MAFMGPTPTGLIGPGPLARPGPGLSKNTAWNKKDHVSHPESGVLCEVSQGVRDEEFSNQPS